MTNPVDAAAGIHVRGVVTASQIEINPDESFGDGLVLPVHCSNADLLHGAFSGPSLAPVNLVEIRFGVRFFTS
jgi:hypothetical protein